MNILYIHGTNNTQGAKYVGLFNLHHIEFLWSVINLHLPIQILINNMLVLNHSVS